MHMLILVEEKSARMIPAVFVTATGTLYWERSCGSGSAAAAAALGLRHQKSLALILKEPGGPISISSHERRKTDRHHHRRASPY